MSLRDLAPLVRPLMANVAKPVQIEHAKAGTHTRHFFSLAANHEIEGYASLANVKSAQPFCGGSHVFTAMVA
jgi:hypothetical protein